MVKKNGRPRQYKPDLTVPELLALSPNKPDPRIRKKRTQGKFTRKSISEFFFELFAANELAERRLKKTNTAIIDIVVKEFPKNYKLHVNLRGGERNGVNCYRQAYNTGRLVPGRPVVHISFRYNERGDRVDYATGKKILSVPDQKEFLNRYSHKIMQSYSKFRTKAEQADAKTKNDPKG